jgi:hypothetical protein
LVGGVGDDVRFLLETSPTVDTERVPNISLVVYMAFGDLVGSRTVLVESSPYSLYFIGRKSRFGVFLSIESIVLIASNGSGLPPVTL